MSDDSATVASCLQVHGSMSDDEVAAFVRHCHALDTRLRSFRADDVRLDLHLKDRDTKSQHLTLDAHISGLPHLAATSDASDLAHGLNVVRDEMVRLVSDAKETHRARDTERFRSA